MSDPTREHAGQNHNRSPKHTPKHIKRPMHLRAHDPAEPLGRPDIRPWHVALSVVLTASLVVAGLHTDAIADVLGLSATAEPTEVTETAQPAAGDAGAATSEAAPAAGSSEELASAERETEETGRAAAEEIEREQDEAAAREAEQSAAAAAAASASVAAEPTTSTPATDAQATADAEAKAQAELEAQAKAEEQAKRDSFELAPEGVDEGIAAGKDFSSQRLLIAGVSRQQLTPATRVLSVRLRREGQERLPLLQGEAGRGDGRARHHDLGRRGGGRH